MQEFKDDPRYSYTDFKASIDLLIPMDQDLEKYWTKSIANAFYQFIEKTLK